MHTRVALWHCTAGLIIFPVAKAKAPVCRKLAAEEMQVEVLKHQ